VPCKNPVGPHHPPPQQDRRRRGRAARPRTKILAAWPQGHRRASAAISPRRRSVPDPEPRADLCRRVRGPTWKWGGCPLARCHPPPEARGLPRGHRRVSTSTLRYELKRSDWTYEDDPVPAGSVLVPGVETRRRRGWRGRPRRRFSPRGRHGSATPEAGMVAPRHNRAPRRGGRTCGQVSRGEADAAANPCNGAGGRGRESASPPLTADRAKPAVALRRPTNRLIDFVPVEPRERRRAPHRCADPVQEPQPRSPHLPGVAAVDHGRRLRGPRSRPRCGRGPRWFAGSADAIFQNLNLVYDDPARPHPRFRS